MNFKAPFLLNMRPVWKTHEGSSTSSDVSDEEEFSFLGEVRREKASNYKSSIFMCCWTVFNLVFSTILLCTSPAQAEKEMHFSRWHLSIVNDMDYRLRLCIDVLAPLLDKIDIQVPTRILKMDATLSSLRESIRRTTGPQPRSRCLLGRVGEHAHNSCHRR